MRFRVYNHLTIDPLVGSRLYMCVIMYKEEERTHVLLSFINELYKLGVFSHITVGCKKIMLVFKHLCDVCVVFVWCLCGVC